MSFQVSSEQQTEAKTIDSQLAEIRARIAIDGIDLTTIVEFVSSPDGAFCEDSNLRRTV